MADGASGFYGNTASTSPTLRQGVPTRIGSVTDGGGIDEGGVNRPWRTLTAGASPFDATRQCVFLVYRAMKSYRETNNV